MQSSHYVNLGIVIYFLISCTVADVKPGIDNDITLLYGKRVGLITNPSGVNHELVATIDILFSNPNVKLVALFAPEHGLRGDKPPGQPFPDYVDPITGLPVYSLYSPDGVRAPTKDQINKSGVEMLVLDLQDVGTRVYTVESTMALSLKAAKELGVSMVILDRVNPIGAHDDGVQGPLLDPKYISFIGIWTLTMQHAMTMGELALLFNTEMNINHSELHVIKNVYSTGDDPREALTYANARWILPSPNIPTLLTSLLYPGMVLFEALGQVSLGRGTTVPFQVYGAPFFDNVKVINVLQSKIKSDARLDKLFEGIRIVPIYFIPSSDIHTGKECNGVHLIAIHPESFNTNQSLPIALTLLSSLLDVYSPDDLGVSIQGINIRIGNDRVFPQLVNKVPVMDIVDGWKNDTDQFQLQRKKYLLY